MSRRSICLTRNTNQKRNSITEPFACLFRWIWKYMEYHSLKVLCFLVLITVLLCYLRFFIGKEWLAYMDIGSDTVQQYTPFFNYYSESPIFQFGEWYFNFGLGTVSLGNLDLFAWIPIICGKIAGYKGMMYSLVWMQSLKFVLVAIVCYHYLIQFSFDKRAVILSSYIYTFSGFIVLWGQHYKFSSYFVLLTVIVWRLEVSLKKNALSKDHLLLAIAVAVDVLMDYYGSYMTLLACGCYAIVRTWTIFRWDLIKIAKTLLRLFLSVLLGIGLASIVFIPSIYRIMTASIRITHNYSLSSLPLLYDKEHCLTIMGRYFSNNLLGSINYSGWGNYYEAEQLFFSSFFLFYCIIYIAMGIHLRRVAVRFILIGFFVALPFFPITGLVFNGFVAPFGRYTFVLFPVYALIVAAVFTNLVRMHYRTPLVLSVAFVFYFGAFLLFIKRMPNIGIFVFGAIIVELFLLSLCILSLCFVTNEKRHIVLMIISVIIIINVFTDTFITTNYRSTLTMQYEKETMNSGITEIDEIIEDIPEDDNSVYRLEKTYYNPTRYNDALLQEYCGVSYYCSSENKYILEFIKMVWPEIIDSATNNPYYVLFPQDYKNADMAALLGVKYIISDSILDDCSDYLLIESYDSGKYLYLNTKVESFGSLFTSVINQEDFEGLSMSARKSALMHSVLLNDPLGGAASSIVGDSDNNGLLTTHKNGNNQIICNIKKAEKGYLFLPIPYEQGWSASVNGLNSTVLRADYGFMAVPIPEGDSTVCLDFHMPFLRVGAIITFFSIIISIVFYTKKEV